MSVIVTNRTFTKLRNSQATSYYLAPKDDLIQLVYRVNINFGVAAIQSTPITITAANSLTLNGANWNEYGFIIGDTIQIIGFAPDSPSPSPILETVVILDLQGSLLIHDGALANIGQNFPWDNGTDSSTLAVNPIASAPEAIDVLFNLVPNVGSSSPNSLIDNEVNRLRFNTTGLAISATAGGTQLGNRSGGQIVSSQATRRAPLSGYDFAYDIQIVFKEWLSFEESAPNSQPWFNGANSIRPFTTNNIFRQLTNPNSVLTFTDNYALGNVGNYNQNYNQGLNPFTFVASYEVNGDSVAGIAYNAPTDVSIVISGTGTFQAGYLVTLINVPFTDRYKNQLTDFGQNTLMIRILNGTQQVSVLNGANWNASSIVSDVSVSGQITISFTLTPNAALVTLFEGFGVGDRWLKLSTTVQTTAGTATNNDATTLLIYNSEAIEVEPVGGEADEVFAYGMFDHVANPVLIEGDALTLTEDDLLINGVFRLQKDRNYNAINAKIQVVRDSDGAAFDLLSKSVNAQNYPLTTDNKRLFNFSEPTNFQLPNPNRDLVTLVYSGTETVDDYDVNLQLPFINSWRYWIAKNNALIDFLDISIPNNGLNDEWVRYAVSGFSFRVRFEFIRDGLVWYDNRVLDILDYDSNVDITTTIVLEDLDGNVISGISNNQDVIVKAIHVNSVGSWDVITDVWGWIAARPFEQEPRRLISTEFPWTSNNLPLQPIVGETQATKVVVGDTLTVTARIPAGAVNQNTTLVARCGTLRQNSNVHKREVPYVQIPIQVTDEDRGLKRCGEPRLALADVECCEQWKNDVYGVALIADSINVLLVKDGVEYPALGYEVTMPYQENATGFVIDWRQNLIAYGAGCYKIKVEYDILGFTGYYFDSVFQLYPYSVEASEGTVQIIANYNDSVKEFGINFRDSGFYTGLRFKGFFGNEKINSEHNNILKANDIRVKVRNYSQPSYDLVTRPLTRCLTRPLKSILLNASDLFVSDYNVYNHEVYKYFNVILSENDGIEFEGDETFVRQLSAVLLDKNWTTESRFSGHAQPPNLSEIIECSGGGGDCNPATYQLTLDGEPISGGSGSIPSGSNQNIPIDAFVPTCDDSSFTLVNTDATVLDSGTIPSGGSETITAPDAGISLNGVSFPSIPSGGSDNIQVRQATGSTLVGSQQGQHWRIANTTVQLKDTANNNIGAVNSYAAETTNDLTAPDGTVTIRRDGVFYATQAVRSNGAETVNVISDCPTPKGRMPLKTWQTTPQGSGTDGDLQQGYGVSLLVLPYNNPFGTTERFTAPDGSQTYTDAIACDWLSWNDSTNTVLMVHFGSGTGEVLTTNRSLANGIDYINGLTVGGYSGWNMINKNQLEFITENETGLNNLDYAPFNIGALAIQTNTAYSATQRAVRATGGGMSLTTANARTLAVRIGTVTGTGTGTVIS